MLLFWQSKIHVTGFAILLNGCSKGEYYTHEHNKPFFKSSIYLNSKTQEELNNKATHVNAAMPDHRSAQVQKAC